MNTWLHCQAQTEAEVDSGLLSAVVIQASTVCGDLDIFQAEGMLGKFRITSGDLKVQRRFQAVLAKSKSGVLNLSAEMEESLKLDTISHEYRYHQAKISLQSG